MTVGQVRSKLSDETIAAQNISTNVDLLVNEIAACTSAPRRRRPVSMIVHSRARAGLRLGHSAVNEPNYCVH